MKMLLILFVTVLSTHVFGAGYGASNHQTTANMALAHLEHVYKSWPTTPEQKGFLTVAMDEMLIARAHLNLALQNLNNLEAIKVHSQHVAHALDGEGNGPGLGFGIYAASKGVSQHVMLAAKSPGSSSAIQEHALHVATSAKNVRAWSKAALIVTKKVEQSNSLNEALPYLSELEALVDAMQSGVDENQDGSITWVKNEGGLEQANTHMNIIKTAEGI